MKKLIVLMLALGGVLSGCVVYDGPYREGGEHRGGRDGGPHRGDRDRDHDRDGIPDRQDRRPNDAGRY